MKFVLQLDPFGSFLFQSRPIAKKLLFLMPNETDETKPAPPWAKPRLTNPPDRDNPPGYPERKPHLVIVPDELPY